MRCAAAALLLLLPAPIDGFSISSRPGAPRTARAPAAALLLDGLGADLAQKATLVAESIRSFSLAPDDAAQLSAVLSSPKLAVAAFFVPGLSLAFAGRSITTGRRGAYSGDAPYREGEYDPAAADRFFAYRPWLPLGRLFALTSLTGGFIGRVQTDKWAGSANDEATIERRSQELLELVSKLGPTFIKVGKPLCEFSRDAPKLQLQNKPGLAERPTPES
jgi:hypothetical protein